MIDAARRFRSASIAGLLPRFRQAAPAAASPTAAACRPTGHPSRQLARHPPAAACPNSSNPCSGSMSAMPRDLTASSRPASAAMPEPAHGPQLIAVAGKALCAAGVGQRIQERVAGRVVRLTRRAEHAGHRRKQHEEIERPLRAWPRADSTHRGPLGNIARSNCSSVMSVRTPSASTPAA